MARRSIVGHTNAGNRRDLRKALMGVTFRIGGVSYDVIDVSLGGFLISAAPKDFPRGERVIVSSVSSPRDTDVEFQAEAEIVRHERRGAVGGRFVDLSSRNFNIVEGIIMRRRLGTRKAAPVKKKGFLAFFGR